MRTPQLTDRQIDALAVWIVDYLENQGWLAVQPSFRNFETVVSRIKSWFELHRDNHWKY